MYGVVYLDVYWLPGDDELGYLVCVTEHVIINMSTELGDQ